jgi:hypothetical protein
MNDEEVRSRITVVVCLATALALALWALWLRLDVAL